MSYPKDEFVLNTLLSAEGNRKATAQSGSSTTFVSTDLIMGALEAAKYTNGTAVIEGKPVNITSINGTTGTMTFEAVSGLTVGTGTEATIIKPSGGGPTTVTGETPDYKSIVFTNAANPAPDGSVSVAIPSTPSVYTVGKTVGTNFTIPTINTNNGGSGIISHITVFEMLGAGSYVNEAVTHAFSTSSGGTFTRNGHKLLNGNRIWITNGTPPTGLALLTPYYVVGVTANTFQLAQTVGGTAINTSTNGSNITISEIASYTPMRLILSPTALASIADNVLYSPLAAEARNNKFPFNFDQYTYNGNHAISQSPTTMIPYKCAAADNAFYGVLLCNTSASYATPSTTAYFEVKIFEYRY